MDGYYFSYAPSSAPYASAWGEATGGAQDGFGLSVGAGVTTNYPALTPGQMAVQFEWPGGTLTPGMFPDPFDARDLQFGPVIGSDTGITLSLWDGENLYVASGLLDSAQVVPESALAAPVSGVLALMLIGSLPGVHLRTARRRR